MKHDYKSRARIEERIMRALDLLAEALIEEAPEVIESALGIDPEEIKASTKRNMAFLERLAKEKQEREEQ